MPELPTPTDEIPWTAYVDALLGWRRFIVLGIVLGWAAILIAGLALPRTYDCEATLSFPPTTALKKDEPGKPGIPIASYKRFIKALDDETGLSIALQGVLDAAEIRALLQTLDSHVSPLTTSPLGDAQRMSREDTVIGVKVAYSGQPPERTVKIVTSLAKLCRDTLVRTLAQEQLEMRAAQVNDESRVALRERSRVKMEAESLEKLNLDLARLIRESPSDVGGGRQVVDTKDGGYRYLPPAVQLVGVRAKIADLHHEIRVAEHLLSLGGLRLRFIQTLNERLDREASDRPQEDTLGLIREDLKRFLGAQKDEEADLTSLRLEMENLASTLSSFAQTTTLVQLPTVNKKARGPAMLGAAMLAAVLVLTSALLGESWRRLHSKA